MAKKKYKTSKCVDLSYCQRGSNVNFKKLKLAGVTAVILRIGQGGNKDACFESFYAAAKKAGMKIGGYYVPLVSTVPATGSTLRSDATKEAASCHTFIWGKEFQLPIFVDWEDACDDNYKTRSGGNRLNNYGRSQFVGTFLEELGRMRTVGIYANPNYLKYCYDKDWWEKYPLFLASWRNNVKNFTSVSASSVPLTYGAPMVWQFGAGSVSGVDGLVDLDYLYTEV